MCEARKSSSHKNNDKKIKETPVEDTGAQMPIAGLKIDDFDDSPYFLMFLNNAI